MTEADPVGAALTRLLTSKGATVTPIDEDRLSVDNGGRRVEVYLDNLRRDVAQGAPLDDAVANFGARVLRQPSDVDPGARRSGLRLTLERLEIGTGADLAIRPISDTIGICLGWLDDQASGYRLLSRDNLKRWELDEAEAWSIAGSAMDAWLPKVRFEYREAAGSKLGWVDPEGLTQVEAHIKASVVCAPSLKDRLSAELGWPVAAVMPCCDFLFVAPAGASDLIGRLGPTVMKEFNNSPYPLSTEVFRLSDEGFRAIGRFQ